MSDGKKESSAKSNKMSESESNAPGSQSNAPGPVSPRQLDDALQAATSELGTRPVDSVLSIVNRLYPGAQPTTTNPAGDASSGTASPDDLPEALFAQFGLGNIPDKSKSPGSLKSRIGDAVSDLGNKVRKSFGKKEKPQPSQAPGEQEDQAQLATANPAGGDVASSGEPEVAETSGPPSAGKRGKSKSPKSLIGSAAHAARKKFDKVKQFGKRDPEEGAAPVEQGDGEKYLQNEATEEQDDDDNSKGQDDETEKPKTD